MAKLENFDRSYEILANWVEVAFRTQDSLFTPGKALWTVANVDDLYKKFVENPDETKNKFIDKFKNQLEGSSDETLQLAAELLYIQVIAPSGMGRKAKIELVEEVLSWMSSPIPLPEKYKDALSRGFTNDMSFLNHRPFHLTFLLELLRSWNSKPSSEQTQLLKDPWDFKHYLHQLPDKAGQPMREILLHFLFPEVYEAISSRKHKRYIAEAFQDLLTTPTQDVDQNILAIRQSLETKYGKPINFYATAIAKQWQQNVSPQEQDRWPAFMSWIQRCIATESFEEQETEYKRQVSDRLMAAKDAILAEDPTWTDKLQHAFQTENVLTPWQTHQPFLKYVSESPAEAERTLLALWKPTSDPVEKRMKQFDDLLDSKLISGTGGRATLMSFLMMAVDVEKYPIYRSRAFRKATKLSGYKKLPPSPDAVDRYFFALGFLDEIVRSSADWEQPIPNRLVAQSALWLLIKYENKPSDWTDEEWQMLLQFRDGQHVEPEDTETDTDSEEGGELNLESLAESLLIDAEYLNTFIRLLDDKKQIVLYGPPGTGKSYVAQRIAHALAGDAQRVRLVQFHPSYTYEDFFEGFRPAIENGNAVFRLHEGPLKRIANAARNQPDDTFVLIIDEINRGNLAKIFGELYFLLEYRDQSIELQYSHELFQLPENVRIIGTMNTADRSIALIDSALRRRFYFLEFFPDKPPVEGVLRRWLTKHESTMLWIADIVDAANNKIEERDLTIGPSHFMKRGLTEEWTRLIWQHSIIPYLEEHFFGQPDRIQEFDYDLIRQQTNEKNNSPSGENEYENSHTT